jgi:hypothetical protein
MDRGADGGGNDAPHHPQGVYERLAAGALVDGNLLISDLTALARAPAPPRAPAEAARDAALAAQAVNDGSLMINDLTSLVSGLWKRLRVGWDRATRTASEAVAALLDTPAEPGAPTPAPPPLHAPEMPPSSPQFAQQHGRSQVPRRRRSVRRRPSDARCSWCARTCCSCSGTGTCCARSVGAVPVRTVCMCVCVCVCAHVLTRTHVHTHTHPHRITQCRTPIAKRRIRRSRFLLLQDVFISDTCIV